MKIIYQELNKKGILTNPFYCVRIRKEDRHLLPFG